MSRQTLHSWLARYRDGGLGGLVHRSHRPVSCPRRADAEVETAVCELRRHHPRWGPRRIRHELGTKGCPGPVPSRMTVHRILVRHGLIDPTVRKRRRADYRRWQRDAPMQLWQLDIVGGVMLADGVECKVVTGVDDHSRYCVIAAVVPRATGRAVCRLFRRPALRRDPACACDDQAHGHAVPCGTPSVHADHHPLDRRELIRRGLDPDDPAHGRGLCQPCHSKHAAN